MNLHIRTVLISITVFNGRIKQFHIKTGNLNFGRLQ